MTNPFPNKHEIEEYLKIRPGSIDHIPHYARESALFVIQNVRDMEKRDVFRPGLYYIVLSDLCRSTIASSQLGQDLNILRIESFILTCIEALGCIEPRNYFLPIREIGDAILIIFSTFADVHDWWRTMHEWLAVSNFQWRQQLTSSQFHAFSLNAKTVVHVGEVAYSAKNVPIALAVNQVFKLEKKFKGGELGLTHPARSAAAPLLKERGLMARRRDRILLPGDKTPMQTYLIDKWKKTVIER